MGTRSTLRQVTTSSGSTVGLPGIYLRPSLPSGAIPSSVVTGDFNGDGRLDFVVANAGDNTLGLYLGNGDGTVQLPIMIPLKGLSPVAVAAGDLNGDGKLDLVVAESDSQTIGILFGNGDGTFQPEVEIPLPVSPVAVAIADLNNDGRPDLLVGIWQGDDTRFAALLNNGSGQFGSPIYAPDPVNAIVSGTTLSVADVNSDGIPDVLVTGPGPSGDTTQIYLGNGAGGFTAGQIVQESQGGYIDVVNAVLADVNGDGCPDVVGVDVQAQVRIYPGDCKGDFDNSTNYQIYGVGDTAYGLAVADVNHDGYPDIITGGVQEYPSLLFGYETGDTITVRLNDGTGHFGPAQIYRGDPGIYSLAVGDLAGTGFPDIITANQDANSVSVYSNDGSAHFGKPLGGYDGFNEGKQLGPPNAPDSGMVAADVNGDGKPDLALVEYPEPSATARDLTVMLNEGNGQFSSPIRSPVLSSSASLQISDFVLADFRNNGLPDFLAEVYNSSNTSQPQLIYAQNLGNGHFGAPVEIPFSTQGFYGLGVICVGDFNNDGNLDFAVATGPNGNTTPNQLTVYLGHGDGTFTQSYQVSFGSAAGSNGTAWPEAGFVDDANSDGKRDIFIWTYSNVDVPQNTQLYEFLGNGDGTFQAPREVLQNLSAMTMADLNHDGRLDVIDVESGTPTGTAAPQINIYLGQPDGSFGPPTTYSPYSGDFVTPPGGKPGEMNTGLAPYVGDFNGDGNADIAIFHTRTLSGWSAYAQFMTGNGDGSFTPTNDIFGLGIPYIPDFTAANILGNGLSTFLQTPNFSASYQLLPVATAPPFQLASVEIPVMGNADSLDVWLDVPSSADTVVSLSASDPGVQLPSSVTIPAGQVSIQVPFTLSSGIAPNRWFSITAQADGATQTIYNLPGSATSTFVPVVTPPLLDAVQQGQTSQSWSAGIQSIGDASATFQVSCTGLPAGDACQFLNGITSFTVPASSSSNVLFSITTTPNTPAGQYQFDVVETDGLQTFSIPQALQVTAAPPPFTLSVSPNQLNLGTTFVGTTTATQTVTVTNTSSTAVSGLTITPPQGNPTQAGNFQQTTTCGSTLAGNASCLIQDSFAAGTEPGPLSESTSISDPAGSVQVPLSVTVADFSVQAVPGTQTISSVQAGQPAVFQMEITPDFFSGSVQVNCSSAAPATLCTASPSAVNAAYLNSTTFQVTVSSTATGSAPGFYFPTKPNDRSWVLAIAALFAALVFLFLYRSRQESGRARAARALLVFLLFAGTLVLGSCSGGGGGGSTTTQGSTPPQTYAVTVTGSAGNLSRTAQLSVIEK